jgi:hypothetical protein
MRASLVSIVMLLSVASPAFAGDAPFECIFKADNGSVISFAGDENDDGKGHVTVDGQVCTYEAETSITCGGKVEAFVAGQDETLDYKGTHYISTDGCSAGPE